MKPFIEALRDGFNHVTEISDPEQIAVLRGEGIRIDEEGLYVFSFGEKKEYDLRIEPYGEEGHYLVALYKNGVLLNNKLPIWVSTNEQKNI